MWSLRSARAWFVAGLLAFVAASALSESGANAAQDLDVVLNIEFVGDPLDAVDIELGPDDGYYVLDRVGRVHTFGNVTYFGGSPLMADGEKAVSMSMTPDNDGYWVFTSHGRVFAYGAAEFFGDVSDLDLVGPILDSVATQTGLGYYMLAEDGGIFAFGDAEFFGSIPGLFPNSELAGRIVGIAPTDTGNGYWLVGEDGGVFGFGDAEFLGSVPSVLPPGTVLDAPVVAMIGQANAYLLVGADGGIFNFGTSPFHGSIPGFQARSNFRPGVGIAAVASPPDGAGYLMIDQDGTPWPFGEMIVLGQPELAVLHFPPVGVGGLRPPSYFAVVPTDPGDARDCADFLGQGDAQRWFDAYSSFFGDPADLDIDADGRACESVAPGSLGVSTFDPGVQQVGLDIAPGIYRALDADDSCNWARDQDYSPFQVGDFSGDRLVVTIDVTDATFESSPGCGIWSSDLSAITPSQTADVETPNGGVATLIVGVDIAPGLWRLESENEDCRIERLGSFGSIIATADSRWPGNAIRPTDIHPPTLVQILPTDAGIQMSRCSRLTNNLVAVTASMDAPFASGHYIVGLDISPGTWMSEGVVNQVNNDRCYWARLANFAPESANNIVASGSAYGPAILTIEPTDAGFAARESCGVWTKID